MKHLKQPIINTEYIKLAILATCVICYTKFTLVDKPKRDAEVLKLTTIERLK